MKGPPRAAEPTEVREFVVRRVSEDGRHLAAALQDRFGISRQTAHSYIRELLSAGVIERESVGVYRLAEEIHGFRHYVSGLEEHVVWADDIAPLVADLPTNVVDILSYGCQEMINNAIEHSDSETVLVEVRRTAADTRVMIADNGVGIFRKIADALDLEDERHAVLELSKGKVTTDPDNHTGEGIFFTSRAVDKFAISSGDVFFVHDRADDEDWVVGEEFPEEEASGTAVFITMRSDSESSLDDVFNTYATESDDFRFDKTVVPVKLVQYGDDNLVSRSQARRLLSRFERFRTVVLDFDEVPSIGQAFADEVFRVFPAQHPQVEIVPINTNEQVSRMVRRAFDTAAGALPMMPPGKG